MAKETKVGMALIGLLCVGLTGAIAWRLCQPAVGAAAVVNTPRENPGEATAGVVSEHPKVVTPSDADRAISGFGPPTAAGGDGWSRARLASASEPAAAPSLPHYSFMPQTPTAEPTAPVRAPAANLPPETPAPRASYRAADTAEPPQPVPYRSGVAGSERGTLAGPAPRPAAGNPIRAAQNGDGRVEAAPTSGLTGDAARRNPESAGAVPGLLDSGPSYRQDERVADRYSSRSRPDAAQVSPTPIRPPAAVAGYPEPAAGLSRALADDSQDYRGAPSAYGTPPVTRLAAADSLDSSPDRAGGGTCVVQPNDTFWTISERVYGTGAYFKALTRYNAQKFPQADRLAVGDVVQAPPVAVLMQQFPNACPKPRRAAGGNLHVTGLAGPPATGGRQYEVRSGDTLYKIARYELGDGSRWVEIYQLNRQQLTEDYHYLKPGSMLTLPGHKRPTDRPVDMVTRKPDGASQR